MNLPAGTIRTTRVAAAFLALSAFAVAAFGLAPARAFSAPALAETSVTSTTLTPSSATVGDHLTFHIVVARDAGVSVDPPGFGADFGGLEPVEVAPPQDEASGSQTRTTFSFTLVSFSAGDVTIPAIPLVWHASDGTRGTVTSAPQHVRIDSVLQPGETSLRPLKPQLDIAQPAPSPIFPMLFVAAFAVLTAFGYRLIGTAIHTRPVPVFITGAPEQQPPDVRAREALDELSSDEDIQHQYARIAAIVRAYLSERFDFAAYAMTRRELVRDMSRAGVERWPARLTANLLEQCDAVQFAGFRPASERRAADLDAAYEIIEITREREPSLSAEPSPQTF